MDGDRYTRSSPVCYMEQDLYTADDQQLGEDIIRANGDSISGSSYVGSDASSANEVAPRDRGKSRKINDLSSHSGVFEEATLNGATAQKSVSSGSAIVPLIVDPDNLRANPNRGLSVLSSGRNDRDSSRLGFGQVASEACENMGSMADGNTSISDALIDLGTIPDKHQDQRRQGVWGEDPGLASRELEAEMSNQHGGSHKFITGRYAGANTGEGVPVGDGYGSDDVTRDQDDGRDPSAPTPQTSSNFVESVSDSHPSATWEPSNSASNLRPGRDVSEIVLPRWQPDAEMTYCPICRTQFNFFVRKHHCRRCGRVVCNACSPHRITIPYQFIVQPPPAGPAPPFDPVSNMGSGALETNVEHTGRNGGMKVRLCNPCVPDPNPLPPQTQYNGEGRPVPTHYLNSGNQPYSFHEETAGSPARARGLSAASGLRSTDRVSAFLVQPVPDNAVFGDHPLSSEQPNHAGSLMPFPNLNSGRYPGHIPRSDPMRMHGSSSRTSHSSSPGIPNHLRGHSNRHQSLSFVPTGPSSNPQPHYRSLLNTGNEQYARPQPPSTERPLPPVPRVSEDDECPVCHRPLPARNLADYEARRAGHIVQCIDEQIAIHNGTASRPGAYTSIPQPPSTSHNPAGATSLEPPTTSTTSPSALQDLPTLNPSTPARERAHAAIVLGHGRYNSTSTSSSSNPAGPSRRTGMFLYRASEKDCVDDAECTICLEEFEVGAPMARLECFCRFHRRCIQDWFVDHPGRCPVHQHDGYGF